MTTGPILRATPPETPFEEITHSPKTLPFAPSHLPKPQPQNPTPPYPIISSQNHFHPQHLSLSPPPSTKSRNPKTSAAPDPANAAREASKEDGIATIHNFPFPPPSPLSPHKLQRKTQPEKKNEPVRK